MTLCCDVKLHHDVTSFAIHMFIGLFFQNALVDHTGVCTDTNNHFIQYDIKQNSIILLSSSWDSFLSTQTPDLPVAKSRLDL